MLFVPVAIQGQNNSLPAGTRITVNKISYVTNTADIGVLLGPRSVLVALTELVRWPRTFTGSADMWR